MNERFPWWPDDWFCLEHGARGGANRCRLKKYMPQVSGCDMIEVFIAPRSDLLAVVRRGVESGTIKGERVEWCETHEATFFGLDRCGYYLFNDPIYEGDPDPGDCVVASRVVVDLDV